MPPAIPEEHFDGWHEVRLQLEEATRGEFEILKELGRGGMAAVYLAKDLALARNVAIKVMAPGLLMGPGMVDRFRQEAVTVANLIHPNIVTIHTVRQEAHLHFFVMQVVEGASLEDVLARTEPIPIFLIQAILYQLGVGLSYAHRRGVIHRDIKPANVLLDQEGNAILTDFGIAKVTTATNLTQTGSTIGTPAYMSPEQCKAMELTGASDQYSLGILAYEMLTGHPPFAGSPFEIMQAHTAAEPESIRNQRAECPPEVEAAVFRMLKKDPAERFKDVGEAIEALGGYLPGPQDPIRDELVRLVKPGAGSPASGRAPMSPTPGRSARPTPSARTTAPGLASRIRGRLPFWVTGFVALAVVVTLGIVSFLPSSDGGPDPVPSAPHSGTTIRFPNATEEVLVGATIRVLATILDADGRLIAGEAVDWSSSDPGVAAVEGSNQEVAVTGLTAGTATILARAGGVEEGFQVAVIAPAAGELSVSAPSRELLIGGRLTLSAILTDEAGVQVPDPDITWSSSDPRVLEVDPGTGVVTGRGLGRGQVTASFGDQNETVALSVIGRVDAVSINPPRGPLEAGGTTVLRTTVTSRPAGYLGPGGISWSSSNPSVAAISLAGADTVVLILLQPGEAVLTARAGGARNTLTLQVSPAPANVTLSLSTTSVSLSAVEGGDPPTDQTVRVTVSGDATPTVGAVRYGPEGSGWLSPSLGAATGGEATLTIRANVRGLNAGSYSAGVPVRAGGESREVDVRLTVTASPAEGPLEPTDAVAQEITSLLADYSNAINMKNTTRVRELFPSLPQNAVDDLLRIPDTDTYYLQLAPGSLRLGTREETLEGDVMSGVLGRDNRGELVRMVYTFGRGQRGWYIVSLRPGSQTP